MERVERLERLTRRIAVTLTLWAGAIATVERLF
jgi:hypothetical protein